MDRHHGWYVSAKPLWIGLVLSLFLFLTAVLLPLTKPVLLLLAAAQAAVQLIFFMHLGIEEKPRWNLITFWLLALMVFIIVAGSIWIMFHLDYNVMPDMVH
jgi:cytochrome o ubiquinol oxidase operon protein cyoD